MVEGKTKSYYALQLKGEKYKENKKERKKEKMGTVRIYKVPESSSRVEELMKHRPQVMPATSRRMGEGVSFEPNLLQTRSGTTNGERE